MVERETLSRGNDPLIELDANRSIVIAGRCTITLYSETEMRVQCGRLTICVGGDGLELRTLDENELSIGGQIAEVSFLSGA